MPLTDTDIGRWAYSGLVNPGRLLDGRLKIRHLLLVVTIADSGSVIGAARVLHVTQPSVTRGLRDVEEIFGIPLFERHPRGVRPTVYGEAFLEHARAIIGQLRLADEQVHRLSTGELGSVSVGTHLAGSNLLLPRAIAALKAEKPQLVVTVREATPDALEQQLLDGTIELLVGRLTPGASEHLRRERLHDEPIRLVARVGHPAHDLKTPTLAELTRFPWILPVPQTALRAELEQVFFEQDVSLPQDRVECTSMLTLRHLLVSTDVIAALPSHIADQDEGLRLLSTGLSSIRRPVGVSVSKNRPLSPAAQQLLHHLRYEGRVIQAASGPLESEPQSNQ